MKASWWFVFVSLVVSFEKNALGDNSIYKPNLDTLQFIHALWRHGDRIPNHVMPNTKPWTTPLGELTKLGMQQQYELGKFIRERYSGFLNSTYHPHEIRIHASCFNRTVESAMANMVGMYPVTEEEKFLSNLSWRPIPIFTREPRNEYILYTLNRCPTAEREVDNIQRSEHVLRVMEENKDLISFVSEKSGMPAPTLFEFHRIHDVLNSQFYHNDTNPWPEWMNQSLFERISELQNIETTARFSTHVQRRLRAGKLLDEILTRMEQKASNTLANSRLKYYVYSAHDTIMAALLITIGAFNSIHPPYAAAVFFELHKSPTEPDYEIKVIYRNESVPEKVYNLPIANCGSPCYLKQLRRFAVEEDLVPGDWHAECGNTAAAVDAGSLQSLKIAVALMTVACIVLLALLILLVYRHRRPKSVLPV